MEMRVSENGDMVLFQLRGTIDEEGAAHLKTRFKELELSRLNRVEFDFQDVTHIGSAGIGKLLLFYKDVAANGGTIQIVNTPAPVRELFTELHLQTLFSVQ